MRRFIGLLSILAVVVSAGGAAADTTVVLRSASASSETYSFAAVGCANLYGFTNPTASLRATPGPDTPPAGERSWLIDIDGSGNAMGSYTAVDSMAATTTASLSLHTTTAAEGVAYALYQEPDETETQLRWVGRKALAQTAGTWRPVAVAAETYDWVKYDESGAQPTPVLGTATTATVAQMTSAHGDGKGGFVIAFGCDGDPFAMDAWKVGSSGNITTYDLEAPFPQVSITGSPQRITAGGAVTLSGTMTDADQTAYVNAPLVLEAKAYGRTAFSEVGTANTTDTGGAATLTKRPARKTVYRWRYEESDFAEGDLSPIFTVEVRTSVSARLRDSTKRVGQDLVLDGSTTPKKPGVTMTLWRSTADGPVKLDTSTVRADGTYTLRRTVQKAGTWKVFATIPAVSGNLAGKSPVRTATVSR